MRNPEFCHYLGKRHMLLLEVLIALSLVLLCILPLLQPHVVMIQAEKDFIREVQLDRVANELFSDLLLKEFYNQKISWEDIASGRQILIPSDIVKSLGYSGIYQIIHKAPSSQVLNESKPFHLLEILYTFTDQINNKKVLKYSFNLFVQREKPQEATPETKAETPPVKPEVKPGE